jgi:hypothetical protein
VFRSRDGWAPLCDFLGVEVPDEPYPKTNRRAEFFAAVKSGTKSLRLEPNPSDEPTGGARPGSGAGRSP